MTQEMQVLKHINRYGKITSMKAFERYGFTPYAIKATQLTLRQRATAKQGMPLTQWTSLF
jgi:hypothetical protein